MAKKASGDMFKTMSPKAQKTTGGAVTKSGKGGSKKSK